jgi:hypothetical protein
MSAAEIGRAHLTAEGLAGVLGVLLSPFWARATHVVQLGPIRMEQSREPAPPLRSDPDGAAEGSGREQCSVDI